MSVYTIQSLYLNQLKNRENGSLIHTEVQKWLANETVSLNELIDGFTIDEGSTKEAHARLKWQELLTLNLLNSSEKNQKLSHLVRAFELQPWNQGSQYFRLYVALNHYLTQMPVPEVGVHLLESGAALINLKEYAPWLSMPYHPQHLEFGILLCLFGNFLQRSDFEEHVLKLANWQLNTLDYNFLPFAALFTREKDFNNFEKLTLYYLFFRSAAFFTKKESFNVITEALSTHLQKKNSAEEEMINPLWVIIERLLVPVVSEKNLLNLSKQIYDSSTSLIGYRTTERTALCTLHGCHTGLGYLREDDIEIINYGPQYFPLDYCEGFGIEGNHLSDHGMRQTFMESHKHDFSIKGCVRVVDQPLLKNGESLFRGIWLEIKQNYANYQMHIKNGFLSLDGWDSLAFCFFVKTVKCQIGSNLVLSSARLDRFEGDSQPIHLVGCKRTLNLNCLTENVKMQVIPLGGGNNFWGANFLIAFIPNSSQRTYEWSIATEI